MSSNRVLYSSLLLLGLLLTVPSLAQRPAALIRAGDRAMETGDYYTALYHFGQALDQRVDPVTQFKYAEAARNFKSYTTAAEYYALVVEGTEAARFPQALYWLGHCEQRLGKYAEALVHFEAYRQRPDVVPALAEQALTEMTNCRWAMEQEEDQEIRTERLYRRINTPYGEFGAWKTNDTLYYTSYRFEKKDDSYRPQRKISKVLFSRDDRRGRVVGRSFNEDTVHTANVAISRDQQRLYFSRCRFLDGASIQCQLCVRERDRRGRWDRDFTILPEEVNLPGSTTTQPALLWDSTQQKEYLVFVSDRPGGVGGMDLWWTPVPGPDSPWLNASLLGDLNTPGDELSPFYHEASRRLYFSSERSPSFGGLDLFYASMSDEFTWEEPVNLGRPYNSSFDDHYPFIEADGTSGYFSSNRPGGSYIDDLSKTCCPDIFRFEVVPAVDTSTADLPEPATPAITEVEEPVEVEPMPSTLEEFLPLALYFDNDEPDPRTRRASTRKSYTETYDAYLTREETYYTQLQDDEEDLLRIEDFFANEVSFGYRKLERFSEILLQQLENGQEVEIFLKGFTSPRAKSDYNLQLGKRRISSVRNYFDEWREGVFLPYLDSEQLIISEVSFGETQAAASARDEKAGERASIYSVEAARERRVEIVEVKRN